MVKQIDAQTQFHLICVLCCSGTIKSFTNYHCLELGTEPMGLAIEQKRSSELFPCMAS